MLICNNIIKCLLIGVSLMFIVCLIKSFIDDKLGVACNLIVEREYGLYDLLL